MKKLLLVMLFAIPCYALNAQPRISISGGVKLIDAQTRTMTLLYVDESPSRDNIYKDIDPIGNIAINLNVRWQDDTPDKALRLFAEGQGYIGSISGLAFNVGYAYSGTNQGKVRIQPEIGAVLGYCSKGIGAIQNNDVYIQVNQTQFQDYTDVYVSLRNAYIGIKPGLSFIFNTGMNSEIGLGVNYQLSYKAGFISFRGTDNNGIQATEIEYLTARNVGFYVDNNRTDKNPYNPDGLEFKVFYSF
ncbi:MAG: hypothetical protein C0397_09885 [Odoribacter sp.]|nr:hypothetical protein [Odoribacter sp.]